MAGRTVTAHSPASDAPVEHVGATADWSPLADLDVDQQPASGEDTVRRPRHAATQPTGRQALNILTAWAANLPGPAAVAKEIRP